MAVVVCKAILEVAALAALDTRGLLLRAGSVGNFEEDDKALTACIEVMCWVN